MGKKDKAAKKDKAGKKKQPGLPENGALPPADAAGLTRALTGAARSMRTRLSHNLADSGLHAGQDGVILLLDGGASLTPGEIARALGVKAPTMTRTIGRMETQGFVSRNGDGEDGRMTRVRLTQAGQDSVERINTAIAAASTSAVDGMSGKEIRNLIRLLALLEANLNGHEAPADDHEDE